jgi:type IV secretory pathway VirB2 component (pilin)
MRFNHLGRTSAFATVMTMAARPAAAQDWTQPITDFIDLLNSGLGQIGAGVLGVGIIAIGLWAAFTGRMDWNRFAFTLIGGLLVMVGPKIVNALFSAGGE